MQKRVRDDTDGSIDDESDDADSVETEIQSLEHDLRTLTDSRGVFSCPDEKVVTDSFARRLLTRGSIGAAAASRLDDNLREQAFDRALQIRNYVYRDTNLARESVDPLKWNPNLHSVEVRDSHPLIRCWTKIKTIHDILITTLSATALVILQRELRERISALEECVASRQWHPGFPPKLHRDMLEHARLLLIKLTNMQPSGAPVDILADWHASATDTTQRLQHMNRMMCTTASNHEDSDMKSD